MLLWGISLKTGVRMIGVALVLLTSVSIFEEIAYYKMDDNTKHESSPDNDRRGHLDVSAMLGVNASWGYSVVATETREKQRRRTTPWRRTNKPWRRTTNDTDCCNCDCDCDSCSDTVHYECCSDGTDEEEEDDDSSELTVFAILAGAHLIASIIGCYCGFACTLTSSLKDQRVLQSS